MSQKRRVVLAIAITAVLFGVLAAYTGVRLRRWNELGSAGFNYVQGYSDVRPPKMFGVVPGSVLMTDPDGAAHRAGIRVHDEIVSIDGISISNREALRALDRRARRGDTLHFLVRRGGTERDVPVTLQSSLLTPASLASIAVSTFVSLVFLSIGLLVLIRRPDDRRAKVFHIMATAGALSILGSTMATLDTANLRGIIVDPTQMIVPLLVVAAATIAFAPLTLHLALIFPHDRPLLQRSPHVLRWIYGVAASAAIVGLTMFSIGTLASQSRRDAELVDRVVNIGSAALAVMGLLLALRIARIGRRDGVRDAFWRRPIQSIVAVLAMLLGVARVAGALHLKITAVVIGGIGIFAPILAVILYPLFTCIALYRSYKEAGPEERRQVKWPLWGTFTALAVRLTLTVVGNVLTFAFMLRGGDVGGMMRFAQVLQIVPPLLYLLIPISFAIAIFKYRLMNIDVIIRKTVVYAILSGAIIVLYLGLVGIIGTLVVGATGLQNQTLVIAATVVIALVFVPLRNRLQSLVERNLFRHRFEYPDALRAIVTESAAAHDLGPYLTATAEKLQSALQNRAVVLFVERQDEYVAAAKVGVADSLVGVLRLPGTFRTLLDRPFDPRKRAAGDESARTLARIETALVVPVATRGFIAAAPKLSRGEFDVEDIDFLRSAADQMAVVIDRVRMQVDEADFAQARAIQETLLPRAMPRIEGIDVSGIWQPARMMGGDYFDVIELGPRELAVCIGDVAGKGMPAALLMSGLQAAVRASASSSPRDLCERVRRVVVSSLSGGRFVTFFYATIDAATMTLRWCNAGHNAPILARADGSIVRLAEGGPAISRLFRDDPYRECELPLAAGDRLLLFTDGASETGDARGELFGETRLEAIAANARGTDARELQQRVLDAVNAYRGSGEAEDDLTLVAVAL
ncbi:MAG TPA: SpoIIE family protein phosphatase [Thermoanaerobaculia bacterium]|jgi:serine phosphatase RsbU (regulator of sigma subunit)